MHEWFRKTAAAIANAVGSAWAFGAAAITVAAWAIAGPLFGYSDGWQLFINTSTTIATFLVVFLLQNSQNRDTKQINLKLDELLRAIEGARTRLAGIDELSDRELEALEGEFHDLAHKAAGGMPPAEVAQSAKAVAQASARKRASKPGQRQPPRVTPPSERRRRVRKRTSGLGT